MFQGPKSPLVKKEYLKKQTSPPCPSTSQVPKGGAGVSPDSVQTKEKDSQVCLESQDQTTDSR